MTETCNTCKYYLPAKENGFCRRYPPQVVPAGLTKTLSGMAPAFSNFFPQLEPTAWCGEWGRKNSDLQ